MPRRRFRNGLVGRTDVISFRDWSLEAQTGDSLEGSDVSRLAGSNLKGLWAGLTMSWDETDRPQEAIYAANEQRFDKLGVLLRAFRILDHSPSSS